MSNLIPGVTWTDSNGNDRLIDIASRAYKDRIIYLQGEITEELAAEIELLLLTLESENKEKPIKMIIQSPGGSIQAGYTIIDAMKKVKCPVYTQATGLVASMATTIFINGEKGNRSIRPHCRLLVHQPLGGVNGQASEIEITYKEIQFLKEQLENEYAALTNVPKEKMHEMMDRDTWLSAKEAVKLGLADKIN